MSLSLNQITSNIKHKSCEIIQGLVFAFFGYAWIFVCLTNFPIQRSFVIAFFILVSLVIVMFSSQIRSLINECIVEMSQREDSIDSRRSNVSFRELVDNSVGQLNHRVTNMLALCQQKKLYLLSL